MNAQQRIVTEDRVQKALDYLAESAGKLGAARERAKLAEHKIKHVEALMFKASDETSNDKRQADARTTEAYVKAITEDAQAAGELANLYALREAAAALIEAWRSQEATWRSLKL